MHANGVPRLFFRFTLRVRKLRFLFCRYFREVLLDLLVVVVQDGNNDDARAHPEHLKDTRMEP